MNNLYKYKTKCGLEIIYYKTEGFNKSYCGIGSKFGSSNLKYKKDNKIYELKDGVAHFLEHKLFQMPNNIDSYQLFDEMNVEVNAYTTHDKTTYFFKTMEDIKRPLKLLLDMYFTPCFVEEDIEKEKSIIISEINMSCDNLDMRKNYEIIKHTYPNDDYSTYLTGSSESVLSITKSDLDEAYNVFYSPNNSVLTIVSSINPLNLFQYIEDCLINYNFINNNIEKVATISSEKTCNPKTIYENVSQDEVNVILRIDSLKSDDTLSFEKLMCIFDNIFSISNTYVHKLLNKGLFENDIDFECTSTKDTSYVVINAPSKNCKKFAEEIINKLNNLKISDLDKDLLDIRIKYIKSDYIQSLDNIDYLGDQILSLALEDLDYFDMIKNIDKLNMNLLNEVIQIIRNCQKSYLIIKSKKV